MSFKKIVILPLGFILVHALYIGCCKCVEGTFYRDLSSVRAVESSRSTLNTIDTVKVTDTLFCTIMLHYTSITKATPNPFAPLVNAAYATSCRCDYIDHGYKFPLDSITISSDHAFSGMPAGQNIGGFFKAVYASTASSNPSPPVVYLTLPQLCDSLNANRVYSDIELISVPGAQPNKTHRLKYTLFSNGKKYETTGRTILFN